MNGNTAKYLSYRAAWKRINAAIESGFYFEAVTISESIICDRLLSFVLGVDPNCGVGATTSFAELIKKWRKLAHPLPADSQYGDLGAAVDAWRKDRNAIVHGLVKSNPGQPTESVSAFLIRAEDTAKRGKTLARRVSDWHKSALRSANEQGSVV